MEVPQRFLSLVSRDFFLFAYLVYVFFSFRGEASFSGAGVFFVSIIDCQALFFFFFLFFFYRETQVRRKASGVHPPPTKYNDRD